MNEDGVAPFFSVVDRTNRAPSTAISAPEPSGGRVVRHSLTCGPIFTGALMSLHTVSALGLLEGGGGDLGLVVGVPAGVSRHIFEGPLESVDQLLLLRGACGSLCLAIWRLGILAGAVLVGAEIAGVGLAS